jgi:hypothetical protein
MLYLCRYETSPCLCACLLTSQTVKSDLQDKACANGQSYGRRRTETTSNKKDVIFICRNYFSRVDGRNFSFESLDIYAAHCMVHRRATKYDKAADEPS